MPKKFHGENTKAVVAKARKEAVRQAEKAKKEKEIEDLYWADDDKSVARKQQRKEDKEKKKQEQMERKKVNRDVLEEEMNSLKSAKPVGPQKVTRSDIQTSLAEMNSKMNAKKSEKTEVPIEENINRIAVDGSEARSITEAISVLSTKEENVEKHPERRMKAAYQAFTDLHLPRLQKENPNLRLSQLKQMLKKDWMKSPDNPMNQNHMAYNA